MSDTMPETPAPAEPAAAVTGVAASATYSLVGSYETVQVLSPTLSNDVVLCTIQTSPSDVIAAKAVQKSVFDQGQAGASLLPFAQAIEQVMDDPRVTGAAGDSIRDDSGLIAYVVTFTVTYTDPVRAPYGASADATVGVDMLDFTDATIGRTLRTGVMGVIDSVYANLQAAAGG